MFFLPQLCGGGAQQVAVLLANKLAESGAEVILALASLQGELASSVQKNCRLIDLKSKKPIRSLRRLSHCIKSEQPEAIICFGIYTGIAATLSKFIFRWDGIVIIRNENNLLHDWSQANWLNRLIGPPLSRWAARRSHVVAVSRTLAQATSTYLRLPPHQVTTILNPVLADIEAPTGARSVVLHPWLQDRATPTFLAMGRLEYQKGFEVLIEAFSLLRQSAHARLVIFGKGALHGKLRAQIESLGLRDTVALAGFTDHPIAQMRAAHAFVLSSQYEGFGLVLVEALWAGTQVISTCCDFGPAELLENGRYGKLVPVNDAQALAQAMLASLEGPRSAERPSDTWFAQFTAAEAARQHLALIESMR